MVLTNVGKKFVYFSLFFMALSMALPWESLDDYTYTESVGVIYNLIPAALFFLGISLVILNPIVNTINKLGTNIVFLILCLVNALVLYYGMQYEPDTYTLGYLLFPISVITFMFGIIFSVKRINGQ